MTDQFSLTEDQLAIQDMARRFTADRITPFAAEWDENSHYPVDVWKAAGELGFGAIYVSEEMGGIGLGLGLSALATRPSYGYAEPSYSYRPAPWSPAWYDYCSDRYRSFNPRTGYFKGYDGEYHFCR